MALFIYLFRGSLWDSIISGKFIENFILFISGNSMGFNPTGGYHDHEGPPWTHPSLPWAQRLALVLLGQQVMANPYNPITLPSMTADVGAFIKIFSGMNPVSS
jgi:hypothetical protein